MKKDLVSLLIPAYNAESYIGRLLDSILIQTYSSVEVLVINDGSTDETIDVATSYKAAFERRGYPFRLVTQANEGLSSTINNGLKLIDGEYLAWPDMDDWYRTPYAIERIVKALKQGGHEVGIARCAYERISEETMTTIRIDIPSHTDKPSCIFEDAVFSRKGYWPEPGGWMIKTEMLDKFIPDRNIFTTRLGGQNAQIIWPYLFYSKCISIKESLYCYLIRKDSHSRGGMDTYEKKVQQQKDYYDTFSAVISAIKDMNEKDREKYLTYINEKRLFVLFRMALRYSKHEDVRALYEDYKNNAHFYPVSYLDSIFYSLSVLPGGLKVLNVIRNLKS